MKRPRSRAVALGIACVMMALSAPRDLPGAEREVGVRAGWEMFVLGEYARAASEFERAAKGAVPGSGAHLAALYGLATTWQLRESGRDLQRAGALFEEIVRRGPRSDFAAWSLLALARMKYLVPAGKEPDRGLVLAAYQRAIDAFPAHPAAQEAFIYQQALRISTLGREEAERCAAALAKYVESDAIYRSVAYSLLAQCHAILGEPKRQLAAEIRALETLGSDSGNPTLDKAAQYWRIATIAEFEVGDFAVARKYYGLLLREYPTDQRGFAAEKALVRMEALERKVRGGRP